MDPVIRNISDTAVLAAMHRARQSERPGALFHDPFARQLAGPRGERIFRDWPAAEKNAWAWAIRTYLFDQFITQEIERGADLVLNLAAGLDARPYRMTLPASLTWIEIDFPEVLSYKDVALRDEQPVCRLERIALDLSDAAARRSQFESLAGRGTHGLILTEGLLVYLSRDEVGSLARDLAAPRTYQRWILDLPSPGLLRMLQKEMGAALTAARAPLRFGPEEGPDFFRPYGWRPLEVRSTFKAAAKQRLLSFPMRLMALLPESQGRQGSRPWSGICLLGKADGT